MSPPLASACAKGRRGWERRRGEERRGEETNKDTIFIENDDSDDDDAGMWGGRLHERHARKAASASARAKRGKNARVRETADNRQLPWLLLLPLPMPLPSPCRCARHRPDVPVPQRPLPAAAPALIATAPRRARRDAAAREATELRKLREHGACWQEQKITNAEDTAAGLKPATSTLNNCRSDTTARQGSRRF